MKAIVVTEAGGPENLQAGRRAGPRRPRRLRDRRGEGHGAEIAPICLQRRGFYPPPKGESEILGLECAGIVAEVGAGAGLRIGDRVMALLPGGGYAERAVIHEKMAIPIPHGMTFEEAAAHT